MVTVKEILDDIGRDTARDKLGVGRAAVSNAVRENVMPPRWYKVIKSLCEEIAIKCPDELFAFIPIRSISNDYAAKSCDLQENEVTDA